jgi:hypothetical protein
MLARQALEPRPTRCRAPGVTGQPRIRVRRHRRQAHPSIRRCRQATRHHRRSDVDPTQAVHLRARTPRDTHAPRGSQASRALLRSRTDERTHDRPQQGRPPTQPSWAQHELTPTYVACQRVEMANELHSALPRLGPSAPLTTLTAGVRGQPRRTQRDALIPAVRRCGSARSTSPEYATDGVVDRLSDRSGPHAPRASRWRASPRPHWRVVRRAPIGRPAPRTAR